MENGWKVNHSRRYKMKYEFILGNNALILPGNVKKHLKNATGEDTRVLVALAAYGPSDEFDLSEKLGMSPSAVKESLSFWRGTGIIKSQTETEEKTEEPKKEKAPEPESYSYTGEEIEKICRDNQELRDIINQAQEILGKSFSTSECNVIVYLYDHLRLDSEYIWMLCTYCKNRGHITLRYLEKTAIGLCDRGIDNTERLEAFLKEEGKRNDVEFYIRKLFGMGERALTPAEMKYIKTWCSDYSLSKEMLEKAYNQMMGRIDKPSMKYMDTILSSWHRDSIDTPDKAEESQKNFKAQKKSKKEKENSSFDIDEFFALATSRGKSSEKKEGK